MTRDRAKQLMEKPANSRLKPLCACVCVCVCVCVYVRFWNRGGVQIDDSLQPEKPFRSNCRSEVATVPARGIDNASVKSAGTDSTVCRPEYQQKTQNQDKDARNRSPEANGKVLLQTLPSGYKVARFMVRGCKFEIDSIYAPIKPIGKGAYGIVW